MISHGVSNSEFHSDTVMQHDEFELKFRANPTAFLRLEATDPTGFDSVLALFGVNGESHPMYTD